MSYLFHVKPVNNESQIDTQERRMSETRLYFSWWRGGMPDLHNWHLHNFCNFLERLFTKNIQIVAFVPLTQTVRVLECLVFKLKI